MISGIFKLFFGVLELFDMTDEELKQPIESCDTLFKDFLTGANHGDAWKDNQRDNLYIETYDRLIGDTIAETVANYDTMAKAEIGVTGTWKDSEKALSCYSTISSACGTVGELRLVTGLRLAHARFLLENAPFKQKILAISNVLILPAEKVIKSFE